MRSILRRLVTPTSLAVVCAASAIAGFVAPAPDGIDDLPLEKQVLLPAAEASFEIPGLFRLGSAQMTYYETDAGAKVFAAGAFLFASSALAEPVSTILENLWRRLAPD